MPIHVLQAGESLVSVAQAHDFLDWHTLYDHAGNEKLRQQRQHPNALREGDQVFVPEKIKSPTSFATGQRHQVKVTLGRGVWNLRFSAPKASCGQKVKLTGESNLPDGPLELAWRPRELPSPKLTTLRVAIRTASSSTSGRSRTSSTSPPTRPPRPSTR
jgi:hypothetical protein